MIYLGSTDCSCARCSAPGASRWLSYLFCAACLVAVQAEYAGYERYVRNLLWRRSLR